MSLVVQDLSKKYGTRTVVDHLSFEMNRPGVYALLGTNGAGKTTSIRMMLGMLSRDSGTVTWNGKPLDINTCNVGYLAEERGLYPKYTIMDQLMYFAALRGVSASEAKKRIHYWAERFDIIEYLYPQEYADIQALDHSKTILSGNLNTIKKSYGRVHLFLKTESDITSYIHDAGISILSELAGEYHLKVTGEAQANALLGTLIQAGITIVTFNLREPSLHEIFVSKVGEAHEE